MFFGKKKKIIIFILFGVLFIFAMLYFSLGYILEKCFKTSDLERFLNEQSGLDYKIEAPKFHTTPDLSFVFGADKFIVYIPQTKKEVLNLDDAEIKIRIFPLIFNRVSVRSFIIQGALLNLKIEENGELEILKYINQEGTKPPQFVFKNTFMDLGQHNINLDDKFNKTKIILDGEFLKCEKFNPKKRLDLKTKGKILIGDKTSFYDIDLFLKLPLKKHLDSEDINLNLKIKDFNLSSISTYFKNSNVFKTQGILNTDITTKEEEKNKFFDVDLSIKNLLVLGRDFSIKNSDELKLSSDILLCDDKAQISNFSLKSENINVDAKGTVKNITRKKPKLDMNFEIHDSEIYDILALFPEFLDKSEFSSAIKMKKYNVHSRLSGNLNIVGNTPEPMIYGNVDIQKLFITEKRSYIPYSYGKTEFTGDKVKVDVTARGSEKEEVYIDGISEIYGEKYAEFHISSTKNVDLDTTMFILCPVRDMVGFNLGPLPIMKLKGLGSIDIFTKGTIKKATIDGWFEFRNTRATIEGINDWLNSASGKILFKTKDIVFENWRAKLYQANVRVNGGGDVFGNVNMTFDISDLPFDKAVNISKTSDMIRHYVSGMEYIKEPKGLLDISINLSGLVLNCTKEELMDKLQINGLITLKNASAKVLSNVKLNSLNGNIQFGEKIYPAINGNIYNSPFTLNGFIEQKQNGQNININFISDKINAVDLYRILNVKNDFVEKLKFYFAPNINIQGNIPSDISKIKAENLKLKGTIRGVNSPESNLKFNSGIVRINDKEVIFDNLNIGYYDSKLFIKGNIKNILSKTPKPQISCAMKNFGIDTLIRVLSLSEKLPIFNDLENFKGTLSGNFSLNGNKFKGEINPNNVDCYMKSKKMNIALKSGNIFLENNSLKLNAFNILLGDTPLYFDSSIKDFMSKRPQIDTKFSSNIDSDILNKFVNTSLTYPIGITGEAMLKGRLFGYRDNYSIDSALTLEPENDISYMGANLGDTENKRKININATFSNDIAKINNATYEKFVVSQNNKSKPLVMLKSSGEMRIGDNDIYFKNLKIKTINPTTAKIFNIAFKKSILKRGLFNCDLTINGPLSTIKPLGYIDFSDLNIPLYDLSVQGADLNFKNDYINAVFKLSSHNSDILAQAQAINNFKLPIVLKKLNIESDSISFSKLLDEFAQTSKIQQTTVGHTTSQNIVLNPKDIVIEKGRINAKNVQFNNFSASNLVGEFHHSKDGIFSVDDMVFDIADGKIRTSGTFDFSKVSLNLKSKIENCEADELISSFFNMKGQLFGRMNGDVVFSGANLNTNESIKTIKSKADFEIINGKMPKLGSLEYLLRAGNFYKSGILGFTLNNLIEVLVPYKTGEFNSIKGKIDIYGGKMNNIEIYSKGDNLSIFLNGNYNLVSNNADIVVFGRLSKKVSNVLGPVGNASINSVLNTFTKKENNLSDSYVVQGINKIPLIELSNDEFRLFSARIKGDLNKDNYVKTFRWLN